MIEILHDEGVVTKVQQRVSGPHRGGIPFRRGSLFHLLQNPTYRGKIVHKGKVYDGEHEHIVDEELWDAVQARLKEKAPPRRRPKNNRNDALLNGLITDAEGRPVVPTYATKKTRHYSYYETRKDLARPHHPKPARFRQGVLDQQVISGICDVLDDEHALRRFACDADAGQLRNLFEQAQAMKVKLQSRGNGDALRSLITAIAFQQKNLRIDLNPTLLGMLEQATWSIDIPLPTKRPFREAKLRIDAQALEARASRDLVGLIVDAMDAQRLVIASPELSLNQLAKREGRCRTQLARLLRLSWMSPKIVEAIADGAQLKGLTRRALLSCEMPIDWAEQEKQFGIAT